MGAGQACSYVIGFASLNLLSFASLQMCPSICHFVLSLASLVRSLSHPKGGRQMGGPGGRPRRGRFPPGTTQRKLIYGKGGLEPPGNYMSNGPL